MSDSRDGVGVGFDPVAAFLRRPLHEVLSTSRITLPPPPPITSPSVSTLHQLACNYRWAALLELATTLLAADEEALKPDEKLVCVMLRCRALVQTGQIAAAQHVIAELGDLDGVEYRYETFDEFQGKEGCFVPFELVVLGLEIRVRQGDLRGIAEGYELKRNVLRDESVNEGERKGREGVVLSCLAGWHLVAGQHDAAVDICRELMMKVGEGADGVYMYARMLMVVGDFEAAGKWLKIASRRNGDSEGMKRLHAGMLLGAMGRYQEAIVEYEAAVEVEEGEGGKVWVKGLNNAAVCLMHCGRLAEGIDRLEGALRRNAEVSLDEGVAFNLAVMYDLAYPQNSGEKKKVLRELAERFGRQGFDLQKIPMKEKDKS